MNQISREKAVQSSEVGFKTFRRQCLRRNSGTSFDSTRACLKTTLGCYWSSPCRLKASSFAMAGKTAWSSSLCSP